VRLKAAGTEASRVLRARRDSIAEHVTSLYFWARPRLERRREGGRRKCTEDNRSHVDYLCEALSFEQPSLLTEYGAWAAELLAHLHIRREELAFNLELLRTTLSQELEGESGALASCYLDAALARIGRAVPGAHATVGFLSGSGALDVLARDYLARVLRGDRHGACRLVVDDAERGTSVRDIYLLVFQRVLREVGRLWHSNQIGVAQEHYCTACTLFTMSQLYPRIFSEKRNGLRMVAASVAGDLHEIGLRMVSDFFEMEGWDTFCLGANTPISGILQQVAERAPQVLAISATMTFHIHAVADLITATRAAGNAPRILVGGGAFNSVPGLWKDVGADGYAADAADAVALAAGWCAELPVLRVQALAVGR
jgi:methanogenic corrinoid protein MtbC1